MRTRAIYVMVNTVNGKRYVGQSIKPEHRRAEHFCPGSKKTVIDKAIRKYGPANFIFSVIAVNLDKVAADATERHMI